MERCSAMPRWDCDSPPHGRLAAPLEALRELRVRRNYPYLGKADGFTTYLRRHFPVDRYAGVEFEVNPKHPLGEVGGYPCSRW
jgi:hypothetical protein